MSKVKQNEKKKNYLYLQNIGIYAFEKKKSKL